MNHIQTPDPVQDIARQLGITTFGDGLLVKIRETIDLLTQEAYACQQYRDFMAEPKDVGGKYFATANDLAAALGNVQSLHEMSVELIAGCVFSDDGDHVEDVRAMVKVKGVVMPERDMTSNRLYHPHYSEGWNSCLDEVARLNTAPVQHPDDDAVDRFAVAMKAKLATSREKGRHGWQTATAPHLSALLYEHLYKADPLDVGNLAMMLHQNGQAIELPHEARRPSEPVRQVGVPDEREAFENKYKGLCNFERNKFHPEYYEHEPCRARWQAFQAGAEWKQLQCVEAPSSPAADAYSWRRKESVNGIKQFMTQKCYDAQTDAIKQHYESFKCANCKAADAGLVEALEASNMLLRTKRHACENEHVCHVLDVHIKRNTAALAAHRAQGVV